jgi:hypothetical protein
MLFFSSSVSGHPGHPPDTPCTLSAKFFRGADTPDTPFRKGVRVSALKWCMAVYSCFILQVQQTKDLNL